MIATPAALVGVLALAALPAAAAELRCPPRVPGPHPGFAQAGPVPTAHWLLRRMRLFDTPQGGGTARELAPADRAEDQGGLTLTWHFAGTETLLMICTYNGSSTNYWARPRPLPASCTMRSDNGPRQAWCEVP